MIPTDEEFALKQPNAGSWRMPAAELAADLEGHGRPNPPIATPPTSPRGEASNVSKLWTAFAKRVTFSDKALLPDLDAKVFPLFVEYRLPAAVRD